MAALVALLLLPLGVIGVQFTLDLAGRWGVPGYSLYKLFFLVPPLVYCRVRGIRVFRDILKLRNGKRGLAAAVGLGLFSVAVFWAVYLLLGDRLLDRALIVQKLHDQFRVTPGTVLRIAPFTIVVNSLLEEFFYRGFAYGRLVRRNRTAGLLLPAAAFTVQHALFLREWLAPAPFAIAAAGLLAFAFVLQEAYRRTDSIVAPWVIHAFGDAAMMSIAVSLLDA